MDVHKGVNGGVNGGGVDSHILKKLTQHVYKLFYKTAVLL